MAELFTNPARATNTGNVPLPGAKLYFYTTGTTTPADVYTTSALSVAHSNPVVADSAGLFPAIYLDPEVTYRAVCKDSTGAITVYDVDPIGIGLSGPDGAALIGTADGSTVQASLSAIRSRYDFQDNCLPRAASPTVAVDPSAGNLNGTYYYRVTYFGATGEADASPPSSSISPSNQKVVVTIPVSSDPSVTGRKIYRTAAGEVDAVLGKLVATINDNTTTTYLDNVADDSLGAAVPDFNTSGGVLFLNGQPIASANAISTRFGQAANPANSGYANSAFGANSLSVNTVGFRNTALGVDAMQYNLTGYECTAVGVHALGANTTANQSCAFGYGTLENANANYNAAFGTKAMSATTSGTNNSAFGTFSLQLCTTGTQNAAVGYRAGYGVTTGAGNTCIGANSGEVLASANFNTFVGFQSGISATTSGNTAVGFFSLQSLTSGGDNVAVGANAGKSITTGNGNTFIGPNAGNSGSQKVDAFVSLAIGYGAYTDRDKQVVIGSGALTDETVLYGVLRLTKTYTVATLPSAALMGAGARSFVTDANATTFASVVVGGGANKVPVYSDGSNWLIG